MANPARPTDGMRSFRSIRERIEAKLRQGYRPRGLQGNGPGAIQAAAVDAVEAGEFDTIKGFSSAAYSLPAEEQPDWSLYKPSKAQMPLPSTVLVHPPPPDPENLRPVGEGQRVLVVGDLHQDPRHEHRMDVLTHIARFASEQRFDRIIQVGDWGTFDGASSHDKADSYSARLRPSIKDDLANLQASHQAFRRGISEGYKPRLDFLMGNHEYRLERWENSHPESHQMFTTARDETFAQFGWRVRPYGELHYVEGVAFAHHATNGAGRAFGGKTGPQRGANETTVSIVGGHTHRRQVHDAPKIGPMGVVSMVEVGCAMPWGEVESYLSHGQPVGWWWGVCEMVVHGGLITDLHFHSMMKLADRYGG